MFLIDQQGNSCRACSRVTALGKWRRRQERGGRLKMWGVVVVVVGVGGVVLRQESTRPSTSSSDSPRRGLTRCNYWSQLNQPAKRSWQRWRGGEVGGGTQGRSLWNWIFNQSYKYRPFIQLSVSGEHEHWYKTKFKMDATKGHKSATVLIFLWVINTIYALTNAQFWK